MPLPWMFATLIAPALAADCERPVSTVQVESRLLEAEIAYAGLDLPNFRTAVSNANDALRCLSEPMLPATAARYHRVRGLAAFVARDHDEAARAFAAARMLEPAFRFPDTMVPPGNPLLEDYNRIAIDGGHFTKVPPPATGRVTFDGLPTRMRAEDWPTIFQIQDGAGAVEDTRWLRPQEPLPHYPTGEEKPEHRGPVNKSGRASLLVGAGAGAALSGALFGMSALSRAEYDDNGDDHWRAQASVMQWAAIGVGSAAVTTGVFALVGSTW